MSKLTPEQSYEMGKKAFLNRLPFYPMFNREFWEPNSLCEEPVWQENVNSYHRGWCESEQKQYKKEIC